MIYEDIYAGTRLSLNESNTKYNDTKEKMCARKCNVGELLRALHVIELN